jgi:hypothetical protein
MREVTAGQGRTVADIDTARDWPPAQTAPGRRTWAFVSVSALDIE